MEWPSERVKPGGLFHHPKVTYSKDTHDLIKLLMEEANLTMMQRKNINYHLRNNEPLPAPEEQSRQRLAREDNEDRLAYKILMRARTARRRPLEKIIDSGAFDVDKYVPKNYKETCEKAKLKLQAAMSGLNETPLELANMQMRNRRRLPTYQECERVNDPVAELLSEIYDRADWLAEMEELGEGKKHRLVIQAQIAEKLREIKKIQKMSGSLKGSGSSKSRSSSNSSAASSSSSPT